jgi:hypothetical protein
MFETRKEIKMNRMLRSAGISVMALLLFAFPNAGQCGDWLDQYIAVAAISLGASVDVDCPETSVINAFLANNRSDAENQGTMKGQTYLALYEGME